MVKPASTVAREIADAMDARGIACAVGGALALGVWGFPRATHDVDVTLFVKPDEVDHLLDSLTAIGLELDRAEASRGARDDGQFQARSHGMRVDIYVPCIPYYESVRARIRQAPLEGRPAAFLSPEDLTVFKMLFYRPKDLLDVERLVAFRGTDFDRAYVRRWLVEMVGDDDPRIAAWDGLTASV